MAKRPITCLTLNPSVDLYTTTETVRPADKLRCDPPLREPGGGGLNVARVLARLDTAVRTVYPAGGPMGQWLDGHLTHLSLNPQRQAIAGDTRENLTVRARDSAAEYRFVMPGPSLSAAELQACLDAATAHLRPGDWIVASGSLPPGAPTETWAQLAHAAQARGALCALDTSGAGLRAAIGDSSVRLSLVKPNLRELREATGEALPDAAAWNAAACRWVAQGRTTRVALSLGDRGALLVGPQGAWEAAPLDVRLASSVGAGDSFLAGLLWAIDQGLEDAVALSWGMAAGTAALLHPGTGLAHADDIRRLRPAVKVRAVTVP